MVTVPSVHVPLDWYLVRGIEFPLVRPLLKIAVRTQRRRFEELLELQK
jgi:hypothetical protein